MLDVSFYVQTIIRHRGGGSKSVVRRYFPRYSRYWSAAVSETQEPSTPHPPQHLRGLFEKGCRQCLAKRFLWGGIYCARAPLELGSDNGEWGSFICEVNERVVCLESRWVEWCWYFKLLFACDENSVIWWLIYRMIPNSWDIRLEGMEHYWRSTKCYTTHE